MMKDKNSSGSVLPGISAKYLAPIENWFSFIKNLAVYCAEKYKFKKKFKGWKYEARHYWEVIVFSILNNLGTEDAAETWNSIKFAQENRHLRRKKAPKQLGGRYPRHERRAPDRSQVDVFKRKMPRWFVEKLAEKVLKAQVDLALEMGLISKEINVIVDYNDKPYYGKLNSPVFPSIIGTTKAPGTRWTRKFLGIMIVSGTTRLYSGIKLTTKKTYNDVFVKNAINELHEWGFIIHKILADRWFASKGLLDWCIKRDIEYVGPIKKIKKIKDYINHYLQGGSDIVFVHEIKGAPAKYYGTLPAKVWIVLAARTGYRLSDIRKRFQKGKINLKTAMNEVFVFVVTKKPPRKRKRRASWSTRLVRVYKKRWYIESGFRDLNCFQPPVHARTDATKLFSMMMRCWLYNAWQMQRAMHRRLRNVPSTLQKGPSLRKFCNQVAKSSFGITAFRTA